MDSCLYQPLMQCSQDVGYHLIRLALLAKKTWPVGSKVFYSQHTAHIISQRVSWFFKRGFTRVISMYLFIKQKCSMSGHKAGPDGFGDPGCRRRAPKARCFTKQKDVNCEF